MSCCDLSRTDVRPHEAPPVEAPSPGGQVSGMGERHPVDLPEGYHAAPRAQGWQHRRRLIGELRPGVRRGRAAPGLRDAAGPPRVGTSPRGRVVRQPFVRTSIGTHERRELLDHVHAAQDGCGGIGAGRRRGPTRSASTFGRSMSSPDGQVSEMAQERRAGGGWVGAVRHLLDLHKGYHAPPRAHAWQDRPVDMHDGCARGGARSGLRQVEEMPNRPRRGRGTGPSAGEWATGWPGCRWVTI